MKSKPKLIIALFLLQLMLLFPVNFVHALSISNIKVQDVGASTARIEWFTDEVADGKVDYGPTTDLGVTRKHSTFVFEHSLNLESLDSETDYFFEIESKNIDGTIIIENNNGNFYSFTTKDITPPGKITGVDAISITTDSITITWQASDAVDFSHYNIYRNRILIANTTDNVFTDSGLSSGSDNPYKIAAVDLSGNEGVQSDTITIKTEILDINKPVISNVDFADITDNSATITWSTNEDSTSIVFYGINNTLNNVIESKILQVNHSVILKGLTKDLTYSFVAGSCDLENNCINSSISSFKAGLDLNAPAINVSIPKFVNKKQIDIVGTTEPFSTVKLFVNNLNIPIRALDKSETSEGKIEFLNINLEKENVIKISVTDLAGNKDEETFRVSVDTEDPIVILDEIPNIVSKKNLTIVGTVDEFVFINFFITPGEGNEPEKIDGLNVSVGNNSVVLDWDESEDDDFSHYIIYREDIGPIAITEPLSYNTFTDILVNKNEEYTYWVTSVNKIGRESVKSDSVTVKILSGITGIKDPEPIETKFVEKSSSSINTSGSFSESLKLGKDGTYFLTIEVLDRAKNRVVIEKLLTLDTKKPDIEITNPPAGTLIFENYANEIDIRGITEPNARVHLFIERTPLGNLRDSRGNLNTSFDVSGLPNRIAHLDDAELDAKCSFDLGGHQFCPTSADFSTVADDQGNFEFENVDLTSFLSGGIRIGEVSGREFSEERKLEESQETRLIFIATDSSGLRNAKEHKVRIGTCWSGQQSWEVIPLPEFQRPSLLKPHRLSENKEVIEFFFNYSYIGRGEIGDGLGGITSITTSRACKGVETLDDERFNISCQIMPASGITDLSDDKTISFTIMQLQRIEGMDKFLQDDWESYFDAINNELTFPMRIRIAYTHTVDGKIEHEVQSTCQEVTYILDNNILDPRNVLPDFLLIDGVDFLEDSIKTLNEVNEQIGKVVDFVAVGCASSFVLRLVFQTYRRFVSFSEEKVFVLKELAKTVTGSSYESLTFNVADQETQEYCKQVTQNIIKEFNLEGTNKDNKFTEADLFRNALRGVKLKYYSDRDLKKCFPTVASAWDNEAFWYQTYRFTCDRIFGHTTPSGWTENLGDGQLVEKITSGSVCGVDENIRSQTLLAVKCRDIVSDYGEDPNRYTLDDLCFRAPLTERTSTFFKLVRKAEGTNDIFELSKFEEKRGVVGTQYAQKVSETKYLTNQPQTCAQVCGIDTGSGGGTELTKDAKERMFSTRTNPKIEGQWQCTTTNFCKGLT